MSLDHYFKRLDARWGIPRPASALHLDSYQAAFRLLRDVGEAAALDAAGIVSAFISWKIADLLLRVDIETHHYMIFVMAGCLLISLMESPTLVIPYYRITQ